VCCPAATGQHHQHLESVFNLTQPQGFPFFDFSNQSNLFWSKLTSQKREYDAKNDFIFLIHVKLGLSLEKKTIWSKIFSSPGNSVQK